MVFNIKLDDAAVRTVLEHLDMGQHSKVRRVFDDILGQVQRQEVEASAPKTSEDTGAGLSD
jgi:hypothetical protein